MLHRKWYMLYGILIFFLPEFKITHCILFSGYNFTDNVLAENYQYLFHFSTYFLTDLINKSAVQTINKMSS